MTHRSPLPGTTLSRGRIENTPAQPHHNQTRERLAPLTRSFNSGFAGRRQIGRSGGFQTCGPADFQIGRASQLRGTRRFGNPRYRRLRSLRHQIGGEISGLGVRLARWFPGFTLLLLALALTGCGGRNHSEHVELVMASVPPTPATTFELRFESAMVKGDQVGLPSTNSPLVIRPPLAGTFTWLSSRSGVFTPTEPLTLDTTLSTEAASRPAPRGPTTLRRETALDRHHAAIRRHRHLAAASRHQRPFRTGVQTCLQRRRSRGRRRALCPFATWPDCACLRRCGRAHARIFMAATISAVLTRYGLGNRTRRP